MNSKYTQRQIWTRGVVAALAATVINVVVGIVSARLVDAEPTFLPLQPGPVAAITLVTVLAGTAVFAVLNRFVARPVLVFTVIAAVVALASLVPPIALSSDTSGTIAGVTAPAALALIPLHLIPASVIVAAFAWRRPAVAA